MANILKCLENIDITEEKRFGELGKVVKKWFSDPMISKLYQDDMGPFKRFYHETLKDKDIELSGIPTSKEIKILDKALEKKLKTMKIVPTKFGSYVKLSKNVLMKYPTGKKFFKGLEQADDFHRSHQYDIGSEVGQIKAYLNKASGEAGVMQRYGYGRSKVQKKIADLEKQHDAYIEAGDDAAAFAFWKKNIEKLGPDGEPVALQKLHELMINPDILKSDNSVKEFGSYLIDAATIWHNPPIKGKPALKDRLWKILGDGLKDNISMLKGIETPYSKFAFKVEKLEEIYNDYFSKNAPKKPKNYFPRQVLKLAPTLTKLSEDVNTFKRNNDTSSKRTFEEKSKEVEQYMDNMITDIVTNLKTPVNIYEPVQNAPSRLSKDVLSILDTYTNQAIAFNYNARVSKLTTDAIKELKNLSGSEFNELKTFLVDYIESTHKSALGLQFNNSKLANISRAITSWEFISKLGMNPRTWAKNGTQSLQNWVYWGWKGIAENIFSLSDSRKQIIAEEMRKKGFEFVNIQEFAMPNDLMNNYKVENGKVVEVGPSSFGKFTSYLEDIARITGKPMTWVENKVNRGLTFKIAFNSKYEELLKNPAIVERAIKKANIAKKHQREDYTWKDLDPKEQIKKERIRKSSSYASDMVREIHFDYSPFKKPRILRNPVGSVLGQFSTYSINFFEFQRKIAAKAGEKLLEGEIFNEDTWRLYRLGIMYTAITGLSAITNTSWGNLIENDTWERLKQIDMYIGGDKEEKKKAFYGKKPPIAIFGGPFISDLINIGSLINFSNMNGTDLEAYSQAYQEFSDNTGNMSKTEELIRTINVSLGRQIYTTMPRMINGTSFGTLFGQELGLYGDRDYRDLKDNMLYPIQKYAPSGIAEYFTPDKKKKKRKFKDPGTPLNPNDLKLIQDALDELQASEF